jgi:hypothetical protein
MVMAQQTIIWAAICLVALGLALWRPAAGRLVFGLCFIILAVVTEVVFVLAPPDGFVDLGAAVPPLSPWWVLEQVVAQAPAAFSLLVASYAVAMGLLMAKGGRWGSRGLAGGVVLLLVVAPLCPWTVPGLILAAALGIILLRVPRPPSRLRGVEPGSPDARRVPLGTDCAKKGAPAS